MRIDRKRRFKYAESPRMSRTKTKRITVIAAVFIVAVALVAPHREEEVIIKGHLSEQDIKDIKRTALKNLHDLLSKSFTFDLKEREFRSAWETVKEYHRTRVKQIDVLNPDGVLVAYTTGDTNTHFQDLFIRQTNGLWLKRRFIAGSLYPD